MQYRRFGKTGLDLSVFTLGGMRFLHGWDKPHDVLPADSIDQTRTIIQASVDRGINLIETARGYGKSERLMGRVLPDIVLPERGLHIMSKDHPQESAGEQLRRLEESLGHMGRDSIELFALHGLNKIEHFEQAARPGGCLSALRRAKREGLIGGIGFSTHAPLPDLLQILSRGDFDFVNLHYYVFRQDNKAAVDLAQALEMGVLIISPNDKGGKLYEPPEKLQEQTAPLHPVVFNERWLLSKPGVSTLSVGPMKAEEWEIHLEVLNERSFYGKIEKKIELTLEQARLESPLFACGPCTLCQPCPQEINMPDLLRWLRMVKVHDMTGFAQYRHSMMTKGSHWMPGAHGNLCDDCGDCLPRCPEKLDIPAMVRKAHGLMHVDDQKASA